MPTTQTDSMVEEYVARCSVLLWDLSPELQDQLREDIRQIVGEVAMELDGRPDDLVGPPLRFVSELRIAAGLPEIPAAERRRPGPATPVAESGWLIVGSVLLQLSRTARSVAWPWLKQLATDLRPAWWVARGVGLAFILGSITGWRDQALLPNLFDSQFLGLFSTAGLIIASVQWGRNAPTSVTKRLLWAAASIVAFIALVGFVGQAQYQSGYAYDDGSSEIFRDNPALAVAVIPQELTPATTIAYFGASNGLVNFVDPYSGAIVESVEPHDAVAVALNFLERTGYGEVIVEFQGNQFHSAVGAELVQTVQNLVE